MRHQIPPLLKRMLPCLATALLPVISAHAQGGIDLSTHQFPKNFALPSPEAAAITKVADIPVDLATGQPNISIPLYTINTGKLSVPISLNYDASGIRVEQEASNVGLGWSLSAGGGITRSIRDKDDFYASMKYEQLGGPAWTGAVPSSAMNMAEYQLAHQIANSNQADAIPDLYSYNSPGGGGRFVYLGAVNGAKLMPQKNVAITGNEQQWTLINEAGDVYSFGGNDALGNPAVEKNHLKIVNQTSGSNTAVQLFTVGWPLTKIVHHEKKDVIDFTYTDSYIETITGRTQTHIYEKLDLDYFTTNGLKEAGSSTTFQRHMGKVLTKITFNGGTVEFVVTGNNRADLLAVNNQQPRVEKILVQNTAGVLVREIKFNYDYFIATGFTSGTATIDARRLKLTSVEVLDNGAVKERYKFDYNPTPVPVKSSYAVDHWGFYNGKNNNTTLIPTYNAANPEDEVQGQPAFLLCPDNSVLFEGADRSVDPIYAKAGVLEKITYPTGGTVSFDFESNDLLNLKDEYELQLKEYSSRLVYGPPLQVGSGGTLTAPDASTKRYTVEFDVPNNPHTTNGVFCRVRYEMIAKFGDPANVVDNSGTSAALYQTINGQDVYVNGHQLQSNLPEEKCFDQFKLFPGHYKLMAQSRYSGYAALSFLDMIIPVKKAEANTNVLVGGLRIKQIRYGDALGNEVKKNFQYRKDSSSTLSSGYTYNPITPASYTKQAFTYTKDISRVPSCWYQGQGPGPSWILCCYKELDMLVISSSTNTDNGDGSHVYYHTVKTFDSNGENGSELLKFRRAPDKYRPWENSLAAVKKTFRANGTLVREEMMDYTLMPGAEYYYGLSVIPQGNHPCAQPPDMTQPNSQPGGGYALHYKWGQTKMSSEWMPMTKKTTREFTDQAIELKQEEIYEYNTANKETSKLTRTLSDGRKQVDYFKYPTDYSPGASPGNELKAIGIQKDQHMHSQVIEKYTALKEANGTEHVTTGSYLSSTPDPLSLVTPPGGGAQVHTAVRAADLYQVEATEPISGFQPSQVSGSSVNKDSHYQLQYSVLQYDSRLNPTEVRDAHGVTSSMIWMHNTSMPTAKVANAPLAWTAFSGFEASETGNWTYAAGGVVTSDRVAGSKAYNMTTGGNITKSLSGGGEIIPVFIVSYWRKSGAVTVNGGTPLKTGSTVNGWTYCEHQVVGATIVTVSGTGLIDELRLYPVSAQMETANYNPLVGVTSVGDVKGNLSFYEYDGLSRLTLIRDQNGNIVKKLEYGIQVTE